MSEPRLPLWEVCRSRCVNPLQYRTYQYAPVPFGERAETKLNDATDNISFRTREINRAPLTAHKAAAENIQRIVKSRRPTQQERPKFQRDSASFAISPVFIFVNFTKIWEKPYRFISYLHVSDDLGNEISSADEILTMGKMNAFKMVTLLRRTRNKRITMQYFFTTIRISMPCTA